jgi:hypothetical protein
MHARLSHATGVDRKLNPGILLVFPSEERIFVLWYSCGSDCSTDEHAMLRSRYLRIELDE